jgi:uridine phosphorylase
VPYPNFRNKHARDSLITPRDYLAYARSRRLVPAARPRGLIVAYHRSLMRYVLQNHRARRVKGFFGEMFLLTETHHRVGIIGHFGVGAPQAVIHLEEFIAWGVRRFVSVGTAGSLQPDLRVGDLVLCERAIRDEGSSHHYLAPSRYAYPSKALTARVRTSLRSRDLAYTSGTSWTIDTPYRETVDEAMRYHRQGVLTVEMEAAALFAVGSYRDAEVASLFTISDALCGEKGEMSWRPQFHARRSLRGLEMIYRVAVDALSNRRSPSTAAANPGSARSASP